MDKMIQDLSAYFALNGTLADAVNLTQLVASSAWGDIAKLYKVIQGSI